MKKLKYTDFSLAMHQQLQAGPLNAQIELTFDCNFRCLHCYLGKLRQSRHEEEMPYDAVIKIIDQLYSAKFLWLCFTGGEPLIRPDFKEIYLYAKKKGFIVIILTNGTLIDERLIKIFREDKPFYLEIPINAVDEALYEEISGKQGSFKMFLQGINLLRQNKIPFQLKTKIMNLNLAHLGKIKKFAKKLNVPFGMSPTIHPCLDGDRRPLQFRITPKQMLAFFKAGDEQASCSFTDTYKKSPVKRPLFHCNGLTKSVCIDPSGYLMPCTWMRRWRFDLKAKTITEGLSLLSDLVSQAYFKSDSQCASCEIYDLCEYCPGIAEAENKDLESPVAYFCEVAHLRDAQRKKAFV